MWAWCPDGVGVLRLRLACASRAPGFAQDDTPKSFLSAGGIRFPGFPEGLRVGGLGLRWGVWETVAGLEPFGLLLRRASAGARREW